MLALVTLILLAGAAQPTQPVRATVDVADGVSSSDDLDSSCSLGCAIGWEVKASSSAPGLPVSNLEDWLVETAWTPARDDSAPELVFSFPVSVFGDVQPPVRFDGFLIVPAFSHSTANWQSHARPRSISIAFNGKPVAIAELEDRCVEQTIGLPDIYLRPGDTVQLRFLSVYPGSQDLPLAIAEVVPQGAH